MNKDDHDEPIRVTGNNKADLERELNSAVELAREKAMAERRRGILVTHAAPGRFDVALCDEVPFGVTREMRAW